MMYDNAPGPFPISIGFLRYYFNYYATLCRVWVYWREMRFILVSVTILIVGSSNNLFYEGTESRIFNLEEGFHIIIIIRVCPQIACRPHYSRVPKV
jgi:hypothetical protein